MKLGIIGIGLMGHAFTERFISQGIEVKIYNRSHEKLEDLAESGAIACSSAIELIDTCSTIILLASDADAIQELLPLGQKNSLEGKTFIQMATISPAQSRQLDNDISVCGGHYMEAPVLGSIPEARTGTLIIMAGGDKDLFSETLPLLKIVGSEPRYIGETGTAAALKLAMNQLIASLTAGFSLSLGYIIKNDVDMELFMDTVRESALYAKTYDKKLQKYLNRDFDAANFSSRHLLKDIRLFIEDAKDFGLDTDALEGVERITSKTVESGMDKMDYSSIYEIICPENIP